MKLFVVFSAVVAYVAVHSATATIFTPTIYSAQIPITSQYHAQDSLGQYQYAYEGGPSAKNEIRTIDGITRGSYSYVDADGHIQTVEYTADAINGFQAAATNLPKAPIDNKVAPEPVEETPEVAQARAEHLAAFREAEIRAAKYPDLQSEEESEAINGNGGANGNGGSHGNGGNGSGNGHVPSNGNGAANGNGAGNANGATNNGALNGNGERIPQFITIGSTPATFVAGPLRASAVAVQALGIPSSSFAYRVDAPVAPTIVTAPLTVVRQHPVTVTTRILTDRNIEILRNGNGNNLH